MTEHVEKVQDDENSSDADVSDVSDDSENATEHARAGLADAMAKILQKKVSKQQVILSKAKTDREISRKRIADEDSEDVAPLEHKDFIASQAKKRLWEEMGRIKPDALDRVKEKSLRRIAQRGVVQLFNAVRRQQKVVQEKVAEAGSSERKKDKALQSLSMTKGKFLDLLKGTESNVKSEPQDVNITKVKDEPDDTDQTSQWGVLKEDFMMGAKMKDWDKESDNDNCESENNDDDSDSDAG